MGSDRQAKGSRGCCEGEAGGAWCSRDGELGDTKPEPLLSLLTARPTGPRVERGWRAVPTCVDGVVGVVVPPPNDASAVPLDGGRRWGATS